VLRRPRSGLKLAEKGGQGKAKGREGRKGRDGEKGMEGKLEQDR